MNDLRSFELAESKSPRRAHTGAITLGDIDGRISMLSVECSKCDRKGRYQVPELIKRHGADFGLPNLTYTLSADCPKRKGLFFDRCNLSFPELAALLPVSAPEE